MCNLFIQLIPCDVDSSDGETTGNRGFKTDGANKMNTNYSSEKSKENLKFYIIHYPCNCIIFIKNHNKVLHNTAFYL
jgi:hypothetical protein